MKVIADFTIIPIGEGVSVSHYIATCEKILTDAKLKIKLHAYGTNIEGDWDTVFKALKKCHEVVHDMGAVRISSSIKVGTRTDREQSLEDRIRSVEEKLSK